MIEEAESKLDQQKAERMAEKLVKNKFDLNDLLDQMSQIKNMGSLKSILLKIPRLSQKVKDADVDDRQVDRLCAIILSMTKKERSKPEIINASRKRRIATGCGLKVEDVNSLLRRFEQMQKMMKQFSGSKGKKRFPGMAGMPGFGGLGKFKF